MNGIAATVLRLLYVSRLQRWLVSIGLVVTLLASVALACDWQPDEQPLFGLAAVLGVMIAVIAPIVVGPVLFRALSAPRCIALIPHGRLKLVTGAVCSQLLLAVVIAGTLVALHTTWRFLTTCSIVFGALTMFFMAFSWTIRFRLGAFIWLPVLILPRLLAFFVPQLNLGTWLVTPRGLGAVVAACLLAWLVFARALVGSRRVMPPLWNTVGLRSDPPPLGSPSPSLPPQPATYRQREAVRMLLTGNVNVRRTIVVSVMFMAAVSIIFTLLTPGHPQSGRSAAMWAFIICLFAQFFPGALAGMMARRARLLWLNAGMGRAELFAAIEMHSWRTVLVATGTALIMALPLLTFGTDPRPHVATFLAIVALPLTGGSALIYVGLLYVRGDRPVDLLILLVNAVLLLVVTFSAAAESRMLPALIGFQVILVPLLRQMARARWNNIDWLLLRPPLAAARIA